MCAVGWMEATRQFCLSGPVDPSVRALSGRLKFAVRRHKFNKDSLPLELLLKKDGYPIVHLRHPCELG